LRERRNADLFYADLMRGGGRAVRSVRLAEDDPQEPTVEEIPYALQDGKVTRVARLERAEGSTTLSFTDVAGKAQRVPIIEIRDAPVGQRPTGFRVARSVGTLAAIVSYILLYACGKWKKPYGTEIVFEAGGKRYVGKYAVHNDGPGGPRPTDHPGIDLYEATP
jgi:hypothetical protein